jgi:CRP/FNR family transcriptional activator FtrB
MKPSDSEFTKKMSGGVMRSPDWIAVRALPLFSEMEEEYFDQLVDGAFCHRFPKYANLVTEGDSADFLYVLVDGLVELYGTHDGQRSTLDIMQPVATFTLAAVIRDAVYLKSARTLAPSQILMIPAQTVRQVYRIDHAFADAIVNELAERYSCTVRALKSVKLRNGLERLANWILCADQEQGGQRCVELSFDKRTLASRLGMTPENLSRNLAVLTKHGVRSSGRDIVIENPSALTQLAKPNSLIDG